MQKERYKRRMEEELKIEEMKLQMKKKNEDKGMIVNRNIQVNLPELVITKFEGIHLDWFQFWNQFKTETDKVEISAISKFSYLKEFLAPKVRALIDCLRFTPEGYARAKSILLPNFGKPSEVTTTLIQSITFLPVIFNSNPNKMQGFYEKLIVSLQALDIMHNLRDIKGYVRLILDKLPGIRADLVRLDDVWQEWGFPTFVESLHKWTNSNPKTINNYVKHEKNKRENVF